MGVDRPEQDRDGVGLVVIGGFEAAGPDCLDDGGLVGVALAGDVSLDCSDRHALVGDVVLLAPGGERREEAAVEVCGVCADVPANFFEIDRFNAGGIRSDASEPATEAQVAHATAVIAAWSERGGAALDDAVGELHRPAGGRAEVQREDRARRRTECGRDSAGTCVRRTRGKHAGLLSSERNLVAALPIDRCLAADAGDSCAWEFLLNCEDAVADGLDQDRDLGDGEHTSLACDVVGLVFAANERDDFAGRGQYAFPDLRERACAGLVRGSIERRPGAPHAFDLRGNEALLAGPERGVETILLLVELGAEEIRHEQPQATNAPLAFHVARHLVEAIDHRSNAIGRRRHRIGDGIEPANGPSHGALGGEEASAKVEASRYISNMLAEMRALGLGIIIVDQTPAAVSPQVVRNTNLKIAHRTVAREDRETLADAMLMHPAHAELLGRLVPGQAYIYADRFFRPHLIRSPLRIPDVPIALSAGSPAVGTPVLDDELIEWLGKQNWYREAVIARSGELDAATETALMAVTNLRAKIEAARDELVKLANGISAAQNEAGKPIDSSDELTTRFRNAQFRHGVAVRECIKDLSQRMGSLEAEYRAIVQASKRLGRKAPSEGSIADCRNLLSSLEQVASQLGLTHEPV